MPKLLRPTWSISHHLKELIVVACMLWQLVEHHILQEDTSIIPACLSMP